MPTPFADEESIHATNGFEIDAALTAAEDLVRLAEVDQRSVRNYRVFGVGLLFVAAVLSVSLLVSIVDSLYVVSGWLIATVAPILIAMLAAPVVVISGGIRLTREVDVRFDLARALADHVEVVHLQIAHQENWSRLRLETVQARLAAFSLDGAEGLVK